MTLWCALTAGSAAATLGLNPMSICRNLQPLHCGLHAEVRLVCLKKGCHLYFDPVAGLGQSCFGTRSHLAPPMKGRAAGPYGRLVLLAQAGWCWQWRCCGHAAPVQLLLSDWQSGPWNSLGLFHQ